MTREHSKDQASYSSIPRELSRDQMSRASDQRTQQGPGFPLHWPENTEGPISSSPVTREHSRDQASHSIDPENTAGTRLHTLSAPENAKDAKATEKKWLPFSSLLHSTKGDLRDLSSPFKPAQLCLHSPHSYSPYPLFSII